MKKWWWLINSFIIISLQISCSGRGITGKNPSAGTSSETQQEPADNNHQNNTPADSVTSKDKQIRDDRDKFEAPRHGDPEQGKIDSIKKSKTKH